MKPWARTVEGLPAPAAISLAVADEIASRYATNKIYTTRAVAEAYPHLERALLRDGSEADLAGLDADAWAEGYEAARSLSGRSSGGGRVRGRRRSPSGGELEGSDGGEHSPTPSP